MKNLRRTFTVLFAAAFSMQMLAQREDKLINQDWSFRFSHQVNANAARRVDLPHTWNAQDALGGKYDYKRGIGNYTKKIFIRPEWQSKRLFLRFEGANCVSNVFVNGKHIGEHRGGYGAFVFEITDKVEYGKENTLLVRVNNGEQLDVMPLVGDFNFYGGIYRDLYGQRKHDGVFRYRNQRVSVLDGWFPDAEKRVHHLCQSEDPADRPAELLQPDA